jgi:dTDP-4-dehydrorhamnose 3,5-epimerase
MTLNNSIFYRDGIIEGVIVREVIRHADMRGWLAELFRADELPPAFMPVMSYVSETLPGIARGPHEHVDQTDLFGFLGPGDLKLYLWDSRINSSTFGSKFSRIVGASSPCVVLVPPGVVHAYKSVLDIPVLVFNVPNQLYEGTGKKSSVDEIRHENASDSPYRLD